MLDGEKELMDELFAADATQAFNYMAQLIKQTEEDGNVDKCDELTNALVEKMKEMRDDGKIVVLDKTDILLAEILGFDTSFLG